MLPRQRSKFSKRIRFAFSQVEKPLHWHGLLRVDRRRLPDFLGVGVGKAGTTWLYENLKIHPELYLPEIKELHYFAGSNFHQSLRAYLRYFKPGLGKVKGEISPSYAPLPLGRIRFIRRLIPDVKIVFLLRNPVDRAWSHAKFHLVNGKEEEYESIPPDSFYETFRTWRCRVSGEYTFLLRNWESFFPSEQIFIGFFEDIASRPQQLLEELFRFLGVSTQVDWETFPLRQRFLPGVDIPCPPEYVQFLRGLYRGEQERLGQRFGDRVKGWL